jgi:hypothetical protein
MTVEELIAYLERELAVLASVFVGKPLPVAWGNIPLQIYNIL